MGFFRSLFVFSIVIFAARAQTVSVDDFMSALKRSGPTEIEVLKKKSFIGTEIARAVEDSKRYDRINELNSKLDNLKSQVREIIGHKDALSVARKKIELDIDYLEARFIDVVNFVANTGDLIVITHAIDGSTLNRKIFKISRAREGSDRLTQFFLNQTGISPNVLMCRGPRSAYYILPVESLERVKLDSDGIFRVESPDDVASTGSVGTIIPVDANEVGTYQLAEAVSKGWYLELKTQTLVNMKENAENARQALADYSKIFNYGALISRRSEIESQIDVATKERDQIKPVVVPNDVLTNPEIIKFVKRLAPGVN